MSTETISSNESTGESAMTKPEDKKKALLEYGIVAEKFNLLTNACSDILAYIRRGNGGHETAERVNFIKDTLEAFYGHRVRHRDKFGAVIGLRVKSIDKLIFEKRTRGSKKTGDMEACIKYDDVKKKPVWVDTQKLELIT